MIRALFYITINQLQPSALKLLKTGELWALV